MKLEKFRKLKEDAEQRLKRQYTDAEWDRMFQRRRTLFRIFMPIGSIIGLAIAYDWPGPWLPGVSWSMYLGLVILVLLVFSTIEDLLKKEGMFYRLEDEGQ